MKPWQAFEPPMETPRNETELPIRFPSHDTLPPRPKHQRGSACVLGKIWEKNPHVAILPHDFLVPSEKELAKRARQEKREKKEQRRQYCRDYRAANLEQERKRKRDAARRDMQDPAKREKRRVSYMKYNASPRGKQKRAEYEASLKACPKRKAQRNAYLREKYAADPDYRERKRAQSRLRDALHPPTRAQKDKRNARRRERYRNDADYREKQKARSNRDYRRKQDAEKGNRSPTG